MPFGGMAIAAASSLIPAGMKYFTSRRQRKEAAALKQVDVTPEGVRQNIALARQANAAQRMPGQDIAEAQIQQGTEATLAAARMGATGGGSVMAALAKGNGQRLAALGNLNTRVGAWKEQARQGMVAANNTQGQWDDKSRSEYNNAKAALTQAAEENQMSALQDVAQAGGFIAGNMADQKLAETLAPKGTAGAALGASINADGTMRSLSRAEKLLFRRRLNKQPSVDYTAGTAYSNVG